MTDSKALCKSRRYNKLGWRVAECSLGYYHDGPHTDMHTGHTWERAGEVKPYTFEERRSLN